MTSTSGSMSPHAQQLPPIPPSPARSFASTAFPAASINIPAPPPPPLPGHFLSRADVTASISAYESLADAAKSYRKALSTVAATASAFGSALETCARCKGAGDTADGLMGAGGLQYLVASNVHILSESLYRGFEVPLLHELDTYKEKNAENEDRYKKEATDKTRELRKCEQQHLKLARQKKRNLSAFRSALVDLTYQIDELDNLKYSHYRTALDLSQETSIRVLDSTALVVRAEVEVFEKIAQKGWDSAGGLDDLISRAADPFAPEPGTGNSGDGEIFSILPTESILPTPHGALSRTGSISGAGAGTTTEGKYQSLTGALSPSGDFDEYEDEDAHSIFSGGFSNPGPSKRKLDLPGFAPSSPSSDGWRSPDRSEFIDSDLTHSGNIIDESDESSCTARPDSGQGQTQRGGGVGGWPASEDGETDAEERTIDDHTL